MRTEEEVKHQHKELSHKETHHQTVARYIVATLLASGLCSCFAALLFLFSQEEHGIPEMLLVLMFYLVASDIEHRLRRDDEGFVSVRVPMKKFADNNVQAVEIRLEKGAEEQQQTKTKEDKSRTRKAAMN